MRRSRSRSHSPARAPAKPPVHKPDFGLSGALGGDAAAGGVVGSVRLSWTPPPDSAKPNPAPGQRWRLHVFRGDVQLDPLPLHTQATYLFGRDRRVADVPLDHPSASNQHAVVQHRRVSGGAVTPYVMDLESTHGTTLNTVRMEPARYYELLEGDVLRFGTSSREYVVMRERAGRGETKGTT